MDTREILEELEATRDGLSRAISILGGQWGARPGTRRGRRGPMSVTAKHRISEAMNKRWAERKKAAKAAKKRE